MRPPIVDELLRFAPIQLRDYVQQLEALCIDVAPAEPAVAPDPGRVDDNHLGGFGDGVSRQAALDNYPRSGSQRRQVLLEVAAAGGDGATSDEIAATTGMRLYSVKPRLTELRDGGWIAENGTRPSPAGSATTVFVLTEKGRAQVSAKEGPAILPEATLC